MKLHEPFYIGSRLAPTLKLGDATLSLLTVKPGDDCLPFSPRHRASLALDIPGQPEYLDNSLQSGGGGYRGMVEIFETYIAFLLAAVESYEWQQRNPGRIGENTTLFPLHIVQWASANKMEIECAQLDLYLPGDDCGHVNEQLIEA